MEGQQEWEGRHLGRRLDNEAGGLNLVLGRRTTGAADRDDRLEAREALQRLKVGGEPKALLGPPEPTLQAGVQRIERLVGAAKEREKTGLPEGNRCRLGRLGEGMGAPREQ